MSDESPYDPYIAKDSGPAAPNKTTTDDVRKNVNEAIDVMKGNLDKMKDRGAKINELKDQTATLADSASEFRRGANRVRKQMWWKDMKMRICIAVGIILLLVVIIVPAVVVKH